MKVDTRQGDHQLGTGTKALIHQDHPIHNLSIVTTLNHPYLLLHLSLILMAVNVTLLIKTHQQQQKTRVFFLMFKCLNIRNLGVDEETLAIASEMNSNILGSTNTGLAISDQLTEITKGNIYKVRALLGAARGQGKSVRLLFL